MFCKRVYNAILHLPTFIIWLESIVLLYWQQYCDGEPDIVTCLVARKHDPNFDANCREILVRRQITKNRGIHFILRPTIFL